MNKNPANIEADIVNINKSFSYISTVFLSYDVSLL